MRPFLKATKFPGLFFPLMMGLSMIVLLMYTRVMADLYYQAAASIKASISQAQYKLMSN